MSATWDDERIRQFWEERARQYGRHHQASWSEHEVIEMEIREIVRRLDDGDRVLDTGCANGYSTVRFATQRRIDVKGVDYVAGMIEHALARADSDGPALLGAVRFAVGDVLHLDEPDECYDKVVDPAPHQPRGMGPATERRP